MKGFSATKKNNTLWNMRIVVLHPDPSHPHDVEELDKKKCK